MEVQAKLRPDAPALVFPGLSLSYADMNTRANRLAHYLTGFALPRGGTVGVCLHPCPERVISLLAILKIGCAYLPLDPDYPAKRLVYMVEDARCAVVLHQEASCNAMQAAPTRLLNIDSLTESLAFQATENLTGTVEPDDIAYVIYTSGSTGLPKGVPIAHGSLCNLAQAQIRLFRVIPESRILQFAAFSFDASVSEIFMALCSGAALYLAPRQDLLPGAELSRYLRTEGISHLTLAPSALSVMPMDPLPELQNLVVVGESCPGELAARWQVGRHFYNAYGPTETTVCATVMDCVEPLESVRPPPIGQPIDNMRVHILNKALQPVPIGVTGELYIGGAGLSPGYLGKPALIAERFVNPPWNVGDRIYRSGDLARWLPDGKLEFLGRVDHQVKIRGFRVEPQEIEVTLRTHPNVADAFVAATEGPDHLLRLNAYVKPASTVTDESDYCHELRTFMETRLPRYMMPSTYVVLSEFPRSLSGKIDHRALLAIRPGAPDVAAGRNVEEEFLIELWSRLLVANRVGIHDDFFDLGGHSLLAVDMVKAVNEHFGIQIPVYSLFENPTVARFAGLLGGHPAKAARPRLLVPLQSIGEETPLFCISAGGDVFAYRELAAALGTEQPVFGLRAQGLERGEEPLHNIEAIADQYVREIRRFQAEGPYRLAGWSMGGIVALEAARCLERVGESIELLALFDSYPPAVLRAFHQYGPAEILAQDFGGRFGKYLWPNTGDWLSNPRQAVLQVLHHAVEQDVFQTRPDAEQLERIAHLFLAHFEALLAYTPGHYSGKLTLFRAQNTHNRLPDNGWRAVGIGAMDIHATPGDHHSLLRAPHVKHLAAKLHACLET